MPKSSQLKFDQENPIRLDVFLRHNYPSISRHQIAKIIDDQLVKVNHSFGKPATKLRQGDVVSFENNQFKPLLPAKIELPIIFENDFCLVIDKPSGIITHAKGSYSSEGSVASFVKDKISQELDPLNTNNRAGIVHRLDRGTSGVIIIAKTAAAQKFLNQQFSKRRVSKTYFALVQGKLKQAEAQINMPIERNPKKPSSFRTGPNGKSALTTYQVVASNSEYSLLKLTPLTGRTHQLRVHLRAINHPIVGDIVYGGAPADRLMLHAAALELSLPDIGQKRFISHLPKEFANYIKFTKSQLE